jgi:hypothetical protein
MSGGEWKKGISAEEGAHVIINNLFVYNGSDFC